VPASDPSLKRCLCTVTVRAMPCRPQMLRGEIIDGADQHVAEPKGNFAARHKGSPTPSIPVSRSNFWPSLRAE
jgi:hypothetical protein